MDQRELDVEGMLRTSPDIASRFFRSTVEAGDLVYALRGKLGEVRKVPPEVAGANLTQGTARIAPRSEISSDYLMWAMRGPDAIRQAGYQAKGSTFVEITLENLRNIQIAVPAPPEQRAIATALSDVDALIAGLEKLIAKKRDLKQAAMQQLLTGQNRLPGFSGEWVVKRLGEICEISMGRTPSRLNPAFWGAGHVWLSIADLHGKVLSSSKEQITPLAASSMRVIPEGTLLMSFKLSIGRLCFAGCDLYTNEAICGFNNLLANSDYLYYALSRTDFSLYGKQAVKGYTLNKKSLALVEVALPSDEEQAAIANVLSAMDEEMADLERRLSKTRNLKQGMMQELLTGRTRLV
jgi:type I restriction enzyme S subunit